MKNKVMSAAAAFLIFLISACAADAVKKADNAKKEAIAMSTASIFDFTVKTIDGVDKSLSVYKGKTLLIVNVASKCGFTPQYKDLEALYEKYKSKGFMILGFPSNDFMGQEPGTAQEIKSFCSLTYGVTFDMFDKIHAKANPIAPLYNYLTTEAGFDGDIGWNFTKFLVNKEGKVIARWKSDVKPMDEKIVQAVEKAL